MKNSFCMRTFAGIFATVMLAVLLAGCSLGASGDTRDSAAYSTYSGDAAVVNDAAGAEEASGNEGAGTGLAGDTKTPALTVPQDERKIILHANMILESEAFDDTCGKIENAAQKAGGYISSSNFYSAGSMLSDRSANFTVRVPVEKYSAFLGDVDSAGTVIERSEYSDDVTREYVDIESRLKALRAQETRLLELMEQAGSLKDLLSVQEQLTEVQYQIEDYTASKNTYDNLVSYSTVELEVHEVTRATAITENTYASRVGAAFRESWKNFAEFFREFSIGFVWALPALIVITVIAVVLVFVLRRRVQKKRNADAKNPPAPTGGPTEGNTPGQ